LHTIGVTCYTLCRNINNTFWGICSSCSCIHSGVVDDWIFLRHCRVSDDLSCCSNRYRYSDSASHTCHPPRSMDSTSWGIHSCVARIDGDGTCRYRLDDATDTVEKTGALVDGKWQGAIVIKYPIERKTCRNAHSRSTRSVEMGFFISRFWVVCALLRRYWNGGPQRHLGWFGLHG